MLNIFTQLVSVFAVLLVTITPALGFGGAGSTANADPLKPVVTEEMKALTVPIRIAGTKKILQVPLFSEKYAQMPVAMVNEEPITLAEFTRELATVHSGMGDSETPASQNFSKLLERLIEIKLIKQEALNIGFDRMPAVQNQIEEFELKTLVQHLLAKQVRDLQVDKDAVEELYQQMAIEVNLSVYNFQQQADAEALIKELQNGGDFKLLADTLVAEGKGEKSGGDAEYVKLNDLLPNVAKAVFSMDIGAVSVIFKTEKGFIVFKLEDRRTYEDQQVRLTANNRVLQESSRKKQMDYLNDLIDKYATFDDEVMASLDFAKFLAEDPEATRTEVFSRLGNDQRALVTLINGNETTTITVAEVAGALQASLYHGGERIDASQLNKQKITYIKDKLTALTGRMEAEQQNIQNSVAYLEAVKKFKEQLLFDTFMAKAVLPGLVVSEEEVHKYYNNHLEDYSSPMMIKMSSLIFTNPQDAQEAVNKLQAGSDFKWVSANMTGLADKNDKNILALGDSLLTETALPKDLQKKVKGARQGDIFFYAGPDELYYTLVVESVFPPRTRVYEDVRQEVGKIVYGQKINAAFKEWVRKLKEVYETKIFIVQDKI
ncbi:MAG: peptidyl-prolyl cis-trans isomerase [Desulfuromusa sp.]|nr:peptidyl-prolyl cis-trans isomerase [Desulfuromusa sp.]